MYNHKLQAVSEGETRNMLVESMRITRKEVYSLENLQVNDYDGVVLPGGFGMGKNFSDFAYKGDKFTVNELFEKKMISFHKHNIPIAASCISPLILARIFGKKFYGGEGFTMTLGKNEEGWPFRGTIEIARSFGNTLEEIDVTECLVDKKNKVITAPAYMGGNATPYCVFLGIEKMIDALDKLMH